MKPMTQLPSSKNPHWVHKIQYIIDPAGYMESNRQRYGDLFNAPVFGDKKHQLFICHPQGWQQLFAREGKEIETCGSEVTRFLIGDNALPSLKGDSHQQQKQLLVPSFQSQNMEDYGQSICNLTEQVLSQLTPGTTFYARNVARDIILGSMLNLVFNTEGKEHFEPFKKLLGDFLNIFQSPLITSTFFFPILRQDWGAWIPGASSGSFMQQITEFLYAEIKSHREEYDPTRTDILTLLLSAKYEDGRGMSDSQLFDELMAIVVAGHESATNIIAWALYWILQHPEVVEKLLQEIDSLDECPGAMTIFKLPYLTAVCNEVLRMSPVVPVTPPREVTEPVELMGYQLEPGTELYGCIYLTHHREDLYSEPRRFNPERFLERQYTRYEFLPFGGASRRCLGKTMILFQMKFALVTIFKNYQLALVNHRPLKYKLQGLNIVPKGGVQIVLQGKRKT